MDKEAQRQRLATMFKWGLGLAGAVVISPFVFLAVKGIVGLIIAATVGYVAIELAPVFAMKIANWKLKALKDEAQKNPIETLQNQALAKEEELRLAEADLRGWDAENRGFATDVQAYKRDYPDGDAASMEEILQTSTQAYEGAKDLYLDAVTKLELFRGHIKRVDREWQIALKAGRINARLNAQGRNAALQQMLQDTALQAVQTQLNESMSGLKLAMERRIAQAEAKGGGQNVRVLPAAQAKALGAGTTGEVIDATPVRENVPVRSKKEDRR